MFYQLVVFLHVFCVFGYLLAHGVSAAVSFALKKERDINRVRAMLDLSGASYPAMLWSLLAAIVFGAIRKAVGLPYMVKGKPFPAEPVKSDEEIRVALEKVNPTLLLVIGYGGFAIIAWLMIAKPF